MNDVHEMWQVEAAGKIYETSFDEMTAWIAEGSLIRADKVRKGNLRWIEAGKVPSLIKFFNARDAGEPILPVVTVSTTEPSEQPTDDLLEVPGIIDPEPKVPTAETFMLDLPLTVAAADSCILHTDAPPAYICETCSNKFCRACPKSYGGSVKICPMCGAMCSTLAQVEKKLAENQIRTRATSEGFGFGDFFASLAYPFRFTTSLVLGAVMFAGISLGQSAGALGGLFMFGAALICYLLANMLTFGVLANTIENFSQGKLDLNFMPSFDDFSLWDDVVHPFFLSIGVYISSFGPLIALVLVSIFFVMNAVSSELDGLQSDAARVVRPDLPYAANAVKQSEAVREIIDKQNERAARRAADFERSVAAIDRGEDVPTPTPPPPGFVDEEEAEFQRLSNMIQEHRKAQLESAVGKTPETIDSERQQLVSKILGYGAIFLLLGGVFLLWGLFYFPAACAVAGYTRSFGATLNPSVGLDTIKRLGFDYVKILAMCFVLIVISAFIGGVLSVVFVAFDMPGVGNLPARFVGGLFTFYLSVVFSCVLGFAIYKASDRLQLYQS